MLKSLNLLGNETPLKVSKLKCLWQIWEGEGIIKHYFRKISVGEMCRGETLQAVVNVKRLQMSQGKQAVELESIQGLQMHHAADRRKKSRAAKRREEQLTPAWITRVQCSLHPASSIQFQIYHCMASSQHWDQIPETTRRQVDKATGNLQTTNNKSKSQFITQPTDIFWVSAICLTLGQALEMWQTKQTWP